MAKKLIKVPGTRNDFNKMEIELRENIRRVDAILHDRQTDIRNKFNCIWIRQDLNRAREILKEDKQTDFEEIINTLNGLT